MGNGLNHTANSSVVNYCWERKQARAFRKANSFMRKPHANWGWHLYLLTQNPKVAPKKGGQEKQEREKKYFFFKVTPLEQFYIRDMRQEQNTLWLWFVYRSDKNNRVFFSPTQSRVYKLGLLEPQANQKACFSSLLILAHWCGMTRFW